MKAKGCSGRALFESTIPFRDGGVVHVTGDVEHEFWILKEGRP